MTSKAITDGDAVHQGHQPRPAVHRAFHQPRAGSRRGRFGEEARDPLGTRDGFRRGGDSASLAGRRDVGGRQADERAHVLGLPGLLQRPDDIGVPGRRGRLGLRGGLADMGYSAFTASHTAHGGQEPGATLPGAAPT
ncbi:hypothetical protein [Streptomyces sp. NPDC005017]|uniref:hypothetical protein n=1 Tax=Streptomyces sp. NPDC005017 TaxID=3364706 RepID=UPI0036C41AF2